MSSADLRNSSSYCPTWTGGPGGTGPWPTMGRRETELLGAAEELIRTFLS
ncbi:hypothetical protein ACIHIX_42060 [Streptomyces sp. NPDC051913]